MVGYIEDLIRAQTVLTLVMLQIYLVIIDHTTQAGEVVWTTLTLVILQLDALISMMIKELRELISKGL